MAERLSEEQLKLLHDQVLDRSIKYAGKAIDSNSHKEFMRMIQAATALAITARALRIALGEVDPEIIVYANWGEKIIEKFKV